MQSQSWQDVNLGDPGLLTEASELNQAFIAALTIAHSVADSVMFPLGKIEDVEAVLLGVDARGVVHVDALRRWIDALPGQFLPIDSARDLLRKIYISATIAESVNVEQDVEDNLSGEKGLLTPESGVPVVRSFVGSTTLPAEIWTKSVWSTSPFDAKTFYGDCYGAHGGAVFWRRYSGVPPFYTFGEFSSSDEFAAVVIPPYTDFWLMSKSGNVISWFTAPR